MSEVEYCQSPLCAVDRPAAGFLRAALRFTFALVFLGAYVLSAQEFISKQSASDEPSLRPSAEQEVSIESGTSFGNYVVFGYIEGRRVNPISVEFDRHSFGGFLHARVDYVAEVMPMLLLNEPASYTTSGASLSAARQTVYGGAVYPAGARFLWRPGKSFKPYLIGQGGILYFQRRVVSTEGAKLNYSGKFGLGIEQTLNPRLELRLGYSDFHISNGDTAQHNPGVDMMYFYTGITYHLGRKSTIR